AEKQDLRCPLHLLPRFRRFEREQLCLARGAGRLAHVNMALGRPLPVPLAVLRDAALRAVLAPPLRHGPARADSTAWPECPPPPPVGRPGPLRGAPARCPPRRGRSRDGRALPLEGSAPRPAGAGGRPRGRPGGRGHETAGSCRHPVHPDSYIAITDDAHTPVP